MLPSLGVAVALGKPEVNHIHSRLLCLQPHQEIVWLHVAVNKVVVVHVLQSGDHLVGEHADGLERELATAVLKQIFERVAQQLHHERSVVAFHAKPVDFGNAGCSQTSETS